MATWVRSFTADLVGTADASLTGPADLDTDTSPGDFATDAVNSVQFQFTLSHQGTFGSGTGSDSYALQNVEIQTSASAQLAAITASGTINEGTATVVIDTTDNSPNNGASVADWEGARFESQATNIAIFSQGKGPDGTTPQILAASVTITIDYTPGGVDDTATLSAVPVSIGVPAVTADGEISDTATLTTVPVTVGTPSVALQAGSTPTISAVPVTVGIPAVVALVQQDATPTLTAIPVTVGVPALTVDASVTLTAVGVTTGVPVVAVSADANPTLTAVPVTVGVPGVTTVPLNYLYMPGGAGEDLFIADYPALDVADDLDLRVKVAPDDETPATHNFLMTRVGAIVFFLRLSTGYLSLDVSLSGGDEFPNSGVAVSGGDGVDIWYRVTRESSSGDVQFYTSANGTDWDTLGTVKSTTSGAVSASAAGMFLVGPFVGHVYQAQMFSDLTGTTAVFDVDVTDLTTAELAAEAFTDVTDLTTAELAAEAFTEDSSNAKTVVLNGDEWAYVRPHITNTLLGTAELLLQADDGNEGHSAKWADRSGNDHHGQLGSIAGDDTNDPQSLPWDGENYVYIPGGNLKNVSTPHDAAFNIAGDFQIEVYATFPTAQNGATGRIFSRGTDFNTASWSLSRQGSSDNINFQLNTAADGAIDFFAYDVSAYFDEPHLYKITATWATNDVTVKLYVDGDEKKSATTTSWGSGVAAVTEALEVGALQGGEGFEGKIYYAILYDDVAGSVLARYDANDATEPFATQTGSVDGRTWTYNRSGAGLYVVDRPAFGLHTDDYFEIPDHDDLDFANGEDLTVMVAWRSSNTTEQALLSKSADGGWANPGYTLHTDVGGNGYGTFFIADGSNDAGSEEAVGIVVRTLNVMAGRRDIGNDNVTAFLDGVPDATPTTDATTGTLANALSFYIGRLNGLYDAVNGEIIAVALWRLALTDAEIVEAGIHLGGPAYATLSAVGVTVGIPSVVASADTNPTVTAVPVTVGVPSVTAVGEVNATATLTAIGSTVGVPTVAVTGVNITRAVNLLLGGSIDPATSIDHTIIVRHKGSTSGNATVKLLEGVTERATFALTVTTSWAETLYTLSSGETDAITDYTNLRITIEENPLSETGWLQISQIHMRLTAPVVEPSSVGVTVGIPAVAVASSSIVALSAVPVTVGIPSVTAIGVSDDTATLTAVPVTVGIPAVVASGAADANPTLTTVPVTVGIPVVVASGGVNDEATLTVVPVTIGIPTVTAVGQVNATATLTSIAVTVGIPAVAVQSEVNAVATLTAVAVIVGVPSLTVTASEIVVLSAVGVTVGIPSVGVTVDETVTLSAVEVTVGIPTVAAFAGASTSLTTVPVTIGIPTVTVQGEVNASATLTAVEVTVGIPAVTGVGEVNDTATITAIPVTIGIPAVTAVGVSDATATLTTVPVTIGIPAVAIIADVSVTISAVEVTVGVPSIAAFAGAAASIAAIPVTVGIPAAVATGEVNAAATLTTVPVTVGIPSLVAVGEVNDDTALTTVPVTIGIPSVTATGVSDAAATLTTVPVTIGIPVVGTTVDELVTLSAVPVTVGVPAVAASGGVNDEATLTTVPVTIGIPAVTTVNNVNATATVTAVEVTVGVPAVTVQGEVNDTATLTAVPVTIGIPTVAAFAGAAASITAVEVTVGIPAVVATGVVNATATLTTVPVTVGIPTVTASASADANPTLTAVGVTTGIPAVTAIGGISSVATVAAVPVTVGIPTVTVQGELNAAAVLSALGIDTGVPSLSYTVDTQATLTAVEILATVPLVVVDTSSSVALLTALGVLIGIPQLVASGLSPEIIDIVGGNRVYGDQDRVFVDQERVMKREGRVLR